MNHFNFRILVVFMIGLGIPLSSGCWLWRDCDFTFVPSAPRVNSFNRDAVAPMRRVAMLPTDAREFQNVQFANLLSEQIGSALRAAGKYEVVMITEEQLNICRNQVVTEGRFDERQLAQLARRFNVDGVIYSQLERGNMYGPISADLTCLLVDARESVVISNVSGSWDLSHPADRNRFIQFWELTNNEFVGLDGAESSPNMVASFVAAEIAAEMTSR